MEGTELVHMGDDGADQGADWEGVRILGKLEGSAQRTCWHWT